MKHLPTLLTLALTAYLPLSTGCGLEEVIMGVIVDDPVVTTPIPGSVPEGAGQLRGEIPGAQGEVTLSFYGPLGQTLESQDVDIDYTKSPITYSAVVLPNNNDTLFNVRVVAESGDILWKAIVPDPANGGDTLEVDIDAVSTTLALALEMKPVLRDGAEEVPTPTPSPSPESTDTPETTESPSPTETGTADSTPTPGARIAILEEAPPALGNFPCDGVDLFYEALAGQILAGSGAGYDLFVAVSEALDSGETSWPAVITSHGDLSDPLATLAINAGKSASADGTLLPGTLRVFMGVVRIQKYPDHKCREVDIDKWVNPDEGDSMFLVGGIHEDSPIQDAYIQNEVFPNWVPNLLPLYDDGTHGDDIAGDNIWVRSFVLPETLRIGYKYTYGAQGQNWTGTEEWPGNQRLLEIVDVNGDGVVARFDVFADERSNKDRQNLYEPGGTNITWDTDLDGDGYYEAQEMPADFIGGDCIVDGFWQPFSQPPVTQEGCF